MTSHPVPPFAAFNCAHARRDPRAVDYGGHWLIDAAGTTVLGGEHGTTLVAVAAYLWRECP